MLKEWLEWYTGKNKYKNISDWQVKIIDKLVENQKLTKLLYYTDVDPLRQPPLTPEQIQVIYERHIIPSKPSFKLPNPVTSIYFYLDDIIEDTSLLFVEGKLEVKIITPHHLLHCRDEKGRFSTRNMLIAQEFANATRSPSFFFLNGLNLERQDQRSTFEGNFDCVELQDRHVRIPKSYVNSLLSGFSKLKKLIW